MAQEIIHFSRVSKAYQGEAVLKELDLSVSEGEFVTIIGASGCGKTTTLKLINGLLAPDEGTVTVDGENVAQTDLIALRRKIGYVIQGTGLLPHLTVKKNIAYVPSLSKMWDKKTEEKEVARLLETVGLSAELADRYPSELSGGQKQRVGIARGLAAKPKLLLMDEPFGAVDEITRQALQKAILEIHKELGVTVVFITHDIKEAMKLGSRVIVMDEGKIVQSGTPEEIKMRPANAFVERLTAGY